MQKRIWQTVILFSVLSIPTFASAEGELLKNTLTNTTDIVETATNQVVETTSKVDEVLPVEKNEPVSALLETVNETTKSVTKTVTDEKPLVEVKLSEKPSIKVNANVIEAEVSTKPVLKVETPVSEIKVTEPVQVDVETKNIPTDQINEEVEPIKETSSTVIEKAVGSDVVETNPTIVEPNVKPESVDIFEETETEGIQLSSEDTKTEEFDLQNELPFVPFRGMENIEQIKVIPAIPSGPSTQNSPSSTNNGLTLGIFNTYEVDQSYKTFSYFGKERLFFDQWLNAPPSQPPQSSLFTISRI
ncbi:hypothetical protein [Paenisporosarcina quisquiliarum]|uniref:hypothetical protein n=1 Tax=Paenisporosarcina quisquiliarum TaxID=365346 RepID=UPI0037361E11